MSYYVVCRNNAAEEVEEWGPLSSHFPEFGV